MSEAQTGDSATTPGVAVAKAELDELDAGKTQGNPLGLAQLLDVAVRVTVEVGRAKMTLADLVQLAPGSLITLDRETHKELVCVFLPTSPMPMTGYTMFVDVERVIPLPIPIDEAVRIVMTGGVLLPPQEKVVRAVPPLATPTLAHPGPGPREERA